ncbi:hypothetical protein F0U44_11425 [Nocardioides humilatus]|uniref:Glycerophosphoryl diester phosphodiesterase membrane domain-containing protein n=1 Tax=Nocardioides humilatus TaxID=2607660 RepID=A0A5B1LEI6_9ACTN|nr:hypothetical protein [Nocardioides humilatus]KAA1419065.1 hypothetical protein F0U44_11425 [Nocardioides humilatus]
MTGSHHYPPPGAPLPEEPSAAPTGAPYAPPPPPPPPRSASPMPGMLGAAHKPGAIALRPLSLGDMYDGAFRIIRFNPKATVGAAALVTAVAMVLPVVVSTVTAFTVGSGLDASGGFDDGSSTAETLGLLGSFGSLFIGIYAAQVGVIFVTGMIAHVTRAAAVGRKLTLAEAWAATLGKRWRLLGQAMLVGIIGLLAIAVLIVLIVLVAVATQDVLATILLSLALIGAAVPLYVWLWVKLVSLATPALVLEPIGVFAAFGRCWNLTRGAWWRVFGIALLTVVIVSVAGGILTTPVSLVGNILSGVFIESGVAILVVTQAVTLVIQNAFVAPFTAAVTSLQYLDQRMRKEAYDVELMREAGLIPR